MKNYKEEIKGRIENFKGTLKSLEEKEDYESASITKGKIDLLEDIMETVESGVSAKTFYYSAKHEEHLKDCAIMFGEEYMETYVNGVKYTEMIDSDKTPITKESFGEDMIEVFSGRDYKITHKRG